MSRASSSELPAGARPSSLLLQNRRAKAASAANGDGFDIMSRSGRKPFFPVIASSSAAASSLGLEEPDAKRGGAPQTESSLIGSSGMLPQNEMDDLLRSSDTEADTPKHDYDWLLRPPEAPHGCTREDSHPRMPAEQKKSSSPQLASATRSSKLHVPKSEDGQPERPARSNSATRSSVSSTTPSSFPTNPNKASAQTASVTSRRSSTPNRVPASARPSTPNRVPVSARPSTPNRVPASARPSTPDRISTPAARPSTPNRLSVPARPTPDKIPMPARPSTPNRLPGPARPSTPNRVPASARPSTPNRVSAPVKPSTPNRSSGEARPPSPNRISTSTPAKPSVPVRPSTPNRPSTPSRRATLPSTTSKQADSPTLPVGLRPSTPGKPRQIPVSSDRSETGNSSKQSRPSSRPRTPAASNTSARLNAATSQANPRASTPTRKTTASSSDPVALRSTSAGRFPASAATRNSGAVTRANSPEPEHRAPVQPVIPFDFPFDIPPNLRTKLPERPASAGRARPGAKLTVRENLNPEPLAPANPIRKQSPSRGPIRTNSPNTRNRSSGHGVMQTETKKVTTDGALRKTARTVHSADSSRPGNALTRRSLDMAIKKLDVRRGAGGIRGMSLFPHSIRAAKSSTAGSSGLLTPTSSNETDTEDTSWNDTTSGSASVNDGISENGDAHISYPHEGVFVERIAGQGVYESYGYNALLLKENAKDLDWLKNDEMNIDLLKEDDDLLKGDAKDTEWLHSAENDAEQSPVFRSRFEPLPELLPEPFDFM